MKYCKKCVMPDTRPGIVFDEEGICQGCRTEEKKQRTDWAKRYKELEALCDKHRGRNGKNAPDCVIAVSGGKDSHFQTHIFKEKMGMNPLLVSVEDNFTMTEAGRHNLRNISEAFGCNVIALKPDIRAQRTLMRKCFKKWGKPTWFLDRLIYTYPIRMALAMKIPLVVYGENVGYTYGGVHREETPSAMDQINNGVASDLPWSELMGDGVTEKELYLCEHPAEELKTFELEPVYLSYYVPWSSHYNYNFARSVGFRDLTHEWKREHTIEDYDQIDSYAYIVHAWMKYPKFGHACATDYASRYIRYGLLNREEAIQLVKKHDHKLDQLAVRDFCDFTEMPAREFYEVVDGLYNREIFEKNAHGEWKLKDPIWGQ